MTTPHPQPSVSSPDSQPGQTEVTLVYVVQYQDDGRDHWRDVPYAQYPGLEAARGHESLDDICPLRIIERYTRETIIESLPDRPAEIEPQ